MGLHGSLLTDEFGPLVRYCFVLTDAEIEPDEMYTPHLCDKCGECIKACPGKAINDEEYKKAIEELTANKIDFTE
jgi:epoxyqueuosine reductase QueG